MKHLFFLDIYEKTTKLLNRSHLNRHSNIKSIQKTAAPIFVKFRTTFEKPQPIRYILAYCCSTLR